MLGTGPSTPHCSVTSTNRCVQKRLLAKRGVWMFTTVCKGEVPAVCKPKSIAAVWQVQNRHSWRWQARLVRSFAEMDYSGFGKQTTTLPWSLNTNCGPFLGP